MRKICHLIKVVYYVFPLIMVTSLNFFSMESEYVIEMDDQIEKKILSLSICASQEIIKESIKNTNSFESLLSNIHTLFINEEVPSSIKEDFKNNDYSHVQVAPVTPSDDMQINLNEITGNQSFYFNTRFIIKPVMSEKDALFFVVCGNELPASKNNVYIFDAITLQKISEKIELPSIKLSNGYHLYRVKPHYVVMISNNSLYTFSILEKKCHATQLPWSEDGWASIQSPNEQYIALHSSNGLYIFNVVTQKLTKVLDEPNIDLHNFLFSFDSHFLIARSEKKGTSVIIIDAADPQNIMYIPVFSKAGIKDRILGLFDGTFMVYDHYRKKIKHIDIKSNQEILSWCVDYEVREIACNDQYIFFRGRNKQTDHLMIGAYDKAQSTMIDPLILYTHGKPTEKGDTAHQVLKMIPDPYYKQCLLIVLRNGNVALYEVHKEIRLIAPAIHARGYAYMTELNQKGDLIIAYDCDDKSYIRKLVLRQTLPHLLLKKYLKENKPRQGLEENEIKDLLNLFGNNRQEELKNIFLKNSDTSHAFYGSASYVTPEHQDLMHYIPVICKAMIREPHGNAACCVLCLASGLLGLLMYRLFF